MSQFCRFLGEQNSGMLHAARGVCMPPTATILAVDDDPDVREFTNTVLVDAGFRVLAAVSGEAALLVLDEEPGIDLLLTDIVMPGLSGLDLARQARHRRPDMKILFSSAYWAHIANDLDRDEVLAKPYRAAELIHRVRRALGPAET
jgi:two-component system cell cycle sensor histidine kinase/response regulator CckA